MTRDDDDEMTARPATVMDARNSGGRYSAWWLLVALLPPLLLLFAYRAMESGRASQPAVGDAALPTLPAPRTPVRPGGPDASAMPVEPVGVPAEPPPAGTVPKEAPVVLPVLMPKSPSQAQASSPQTELPEGEAGLTVALRQGLLRPASPADIDRWKRLWNAANGRAVPPSFDEHIRSMDSYVIQKDFTVPKGLSGANAVVFVLEPFAPYPYGDLGHSLLLDLHSGTCRGRVCRMAGV